jgi:hypothetical protein
MATYLDYVLTRYQVTIKGLNRTGISPPKDENKTHFSNILIFYIKNLDEG